MLQRCIPHSLQPLQHVHKHNDLEPIKEAAEIFLRELEQPISNLIVV